MSRALRTRHARIWSHVRVLPSPSLPALPLPVRFWLGVLALGGVAATLAPSLLPQADSLMLSAVRFILALIGGLK